MTVEQKKSILAQISSILDQVVSVPDTTSPNVTENCREMLTINECLDVIKGLSAHTLRIIIAKGDIPSFRTGEGKTGKILVPKSALLDYFDKINNPSR